MRKLLFSFLLLGLTACAGLDLSDFSGGNPLSESEARMGIKEALLKGVGQSVLRASKEDGYFGNPILRIPVPPEAAQIADVLQRIGLGDEIDKAVLAMNRAAEAAAAEAGPIFRNAISELSIGEALQIVGSNQQDAATRFLERETKDQLILVFRPIIDKHMQATQATKLWNDIFTQYNRVPLVRKVDPDLVNYVSGKAIEGLFTLVAEEEKNIRENPAARTSALLRRVFGSS